MKETKKEKTTQTTPEQPYVDPEQINWGKESASGFENTKPEDLGIPFLVILQKGSPQVDKDHKDYETKKLEGAHPGMVINTLTREVLYREDGDPIEFIPAAYIKLFQEWRPRNQGGGFVQSHKSPTILNNCTRNEKKADVLPSGNLIITTSYFYGFYHSENEWKKAIIAMTSTQLKKARAWLNQMTSIRIQGAMPPMYSHLYKLSTVTESNQEGSWKGWKIELDRILTKSDDKVITEAMSTAIAMKEQKLLNGPAPDEESDKEQPTGAF